MRHRNRLASHVVFFGEASTALKPGTGQLTDPGAQLIPPNIRSPCLAFDLKLARCPADPIGAFLGALTSRPPTKGRHTLMNAACFSLIAAYTVCPFGRCSSPTRSLAPMSWKVHYGDLTDISTASRLHVLGRSQPLPSLPCYLHTCRRVYVTTSPQILQANT